MHTLIANERAWALAHNGIAIEKIITIHMNQTNTRYRYTIVGLKMLANIFFSSYKKIKLSILICSKRITKKK